MEMLSFENEKEFEFSEIQKQKQSDYQDVQKMINSSDKFVSCSPDDDKQIEEFDPGQLELKKNFMNKIDDKEEYKNNEFILKDIDTGKVYDLQNKKILDNLTEKVVKINVDPKEKAWQEYWKNIKKMQEKLFDAAELGSYNDLKDLLDKNKNPYPLDLNSRGLDGWTALHFASNEGHLKIVDLLLKNEINLEAITNMGRTALHIATIRGNNEVVECLIGAKADINSQDKEFYTPLHYAAEHGYEKIIHILLNQKPNLKLKNYQGMLASDLCLDIKIKNIFKTYGEVSDNDDYYGRTTIDDSWIQRNSRADHVGRLILVGIQNRKKNHVIENIEKDSPSSAKMPEIEKKVEEIKSSQITITSPKLIKPKIIKISKIPMEKLGPENFIFYKLLGKGSFGEVYLVQLKTGGKHYAMKVLQKDKIINQNLVKYAKAERDVLSIVNHPFMVKLNFAFQNETKLFLVMDYCSGGDLGKLLSKKKKFPEDLARLYISEILLALEALHRSMIIFRDLKPDNVVLDEEGHALLTDFGLSKQGMENNLTQSFCGSVAYLAPEILFKAGHSRMVDWYLMGVMLYELLVGIPPYYSHNREELFENIKRGPLAIPKSLSEEAKSLIKKLLCRNPHQRLGFRTDSEEIKQHPWFKDVNWDDVLERKLKPPTPPQRIIDFNSPLKLKFNDSSKKKNENQIHGWTFCSEEELKKNIN